MWRSVIRIFAVFAAALGLLLITNEILENVSSCNAGACVRVHVSTMLWGLTLLSFGLLILQKGDVSMSLRDMTRAGDVVSTWFGRRSYDRKSGKVTTVTEETSVVVAPTSPIPDHTPASTDLPAARDD